MCAEEKAGSACCLAASNSILAAGSSGFMRRRIVIYARTGARGSGGAGNAARCSVSARRLIRGALGLCLLRYEHPLSCSDHSVRVLLLLLLLCGLTPARKPRRTVFSLYIPG